MLNIGICDDNDDACQTIYNLCKEYFEESDVEHKYIFFSNGNEVLLYCKNMETDQIDILFLDVEMPGISGIDLKDAAIKQDKIWRIVFVTNYKDSVYSAFSKKTIGFIPKPASFEKIKKMLSIIIKEQEENVTLLLRGANGEKIEILLEDIIYMKASGSYTEIVTYTSLSNQANFLLSTKKLGDLEKEIKSSAIIRVHKSYMVNLENVIEIGEKVYLHNLLTTIPVGRSYKAQARKSYLKFGKNRMIKRL